MRDTENEGAASGLSWAPWERFVSARAVWENGWSVWPQQAEGRRQPGIEYDAKGLVQTGLVKWGRLVDQRVSSEELARWESHNRTCNVAVAFGPASGDTFAVDIDVLDDAAAARITEIAGETLGATPLVRIGRAPKVALIYRHAPGAAVASRSPLFAEPGLGGVEILGRGKSLTYAGLHHVTGRPFRWDAEPFAGVEPRNPVFPSRGDASCPIAGRPEHAPLVTAAQVESFLAAVAKEFPFAQGAGGAAVAAEGWDASDAGKLARPALLTSSEWTLDAEGRVSDGREKFLRSLVFAIALRNAEAGIPEDLAAYARAVAAAAVEAFEAAARQDAPRWQGEALKREALAKAARAVRHIAENPSRRFRATAEERQRRVTTVDEFEAEIRGQGMDGWTGPTAEERAADEARAAANRAEAERQREARLAAEAAAAEAEAAEAGADFIPLGHDQGRYFFLARGGQVRDFAARDLAGIGALLELAPLDHWVDNYPSKTGPNARVAANDLIEACLGVGVYDPERLRGRGVWLDGGRVVVHLGDRALVGGVETTPERVSGRFIYERARAMELVVGEEISPEEAVGLLDVCAALPIRDREVMAPLVAGWAVTALVCGAMPWRSHLWATGEKASGKSWFLANVLGPILGPVALQVASKTTEAGIRGLLGLDGRPVIFEEAESQNARDRERIQLVLDLARQASTEGGPDIVKGTQSGGARRYRLNASFAFASINLPLTQAADQSRVIVVNFEPTGSKEERAHGFEQLKDLVRRVITPSFGGRLLARVLRLLPVLRATAEVFASAIARSGRERRIGDTLGTPMAGAWILSQDHVPSAEEADEWLNGLGWLDEAAKGQETDPEWAQACSHLAQTPIEVINSHGNRERVPLGELVFRHASLDAEEAVALRRFGVRVEGSMVWVANSAKPVADAFKDTAWGGAWRTTIGRAPGSERPTKAAKFGALTSKFTAIPLDTFLGAE